MPEENGTTPEQKASPQVAININVTPQGMVLQIAQQPVNLVIDEAGMNQMITQWLAAHPELIDVIVKAQLAKKQMELTIIKNIRESRVN
jgi:hypothetical protein